MNDTSLTDNLVSDGIFGTIFGYMKEHTMITVAIVVLIVLVILIIYYNPSGIFSAKRDKFGSKVDDVSDNSLSDEVDQLISMIEAKQSQA